MSIDAMKQALEALDWAADHIEPQQSHNCDCPVCVASDALRLAIEQAERQEPVAWLQFRDNLLPLVAPRGLGTPVYTAPLPSFGIRGGLAHDQEKQND